MSWEISISPEGWEEIKEELEKQHSLFLAKALAETECQRKFGATITPDEILPFEKLYHQLVNFYINQPKDILVDKVFEEVEKTNTCDNGGFNYWIDPAGIYKICP